MRSASLVLRPGSDGALLVPDLVYPRAFTLRVGRTDQSYVDLDDPLRLEFDYMQRLVDVLDSVAEPGQRLRVVHVGGAAMTLPRYVAATRPTSAQIVLEPDTELIYATNAAYAAKAARGVRYDDPLLSIEWPLPVEMISTSDAAWPPLRQEAVASSLP